MARATVETFQTWGQGATGSASGPDSGPDWRSSAVSTAGSTVDPARRPGCRDHWQSPWHPGSGAAPTGSPPVAGKSPRGFRSSSAPTAQSAINTQVKSIPVKEFHSIKRCRRRAHHNVIHARRSVNVSTYRQCPYVQQFYQLAGSGFATASPAPGPLRGDWGNCALGVLFKKRKRAPQCVVIRMEPPCLPAAVYEPCSCCV